MAYTVASEAQADTGEYCFDGLDGVHAMLVANIATLKGLGNTVTAASIYRAADSLPNRTPAILLEPVDSVAEIWTMGATGSGERRITLRILVTVVDELMGDMVRLTRSVMKIADRVREAFARNTTLDGFCYDSILTPATYGYYAPGEGRRFLLGARMTFTAWKIVDIL